MGTLLNQTPRESCSISIEEFLWEIDVVVMASKESGLTIDQTIKMRSILARERANELYQQNGDIHDEQMAGIGEIGNSIIGLLIDIKHLTP